MAQQWNLDPFEGMGFFFNPDRWMTPGEHKTKRRYEDIYGQLDPTELDLGWISKWGESQTGAAKDAYNWALSEKLKRIAPEAAGRGMWSSPGVRGSLQTKATAPLDQALAQMLSNITSRTATMEGTARQNWEQGNLERLRQQAQLSQLLSELGISGSDIMSGIGSLGGAALGLWAGGPPGALTGAKLGMNFGKGWAGQNRNQWA